MSIPIQTTVLSALLGDDQSKSSLLLSDFYSSGGSQNLYINKFGRILQIPGYAKANATPITCNTSGDACKVVALFPYRLTTSGSFTRQIMAVVDDGSNEWELWYSTNSGSTFTFIADLGSGSVGRIPSFVQYGDQLFIVNGVIATRMWDGTTLTTAGATQLGAPTIGTTNAGPLQGSYKWKLVPRKTDGTRKPGSVASALTQIQNKRADLTWTADADTLVAGYEIYRTSGTGAIFFFVGYSAGRTVVAFTDALPDADLVGRRALGEYGDAPPTGAYIVVQHKGRVWYLRTDAFPRRGWHADPGDPDSVYVDENYIEFTDATTMADVITGGIGDHNGMLVVFEERSVFTVSGTGTIVTTASGSPIVDWSRRRTDAKMGAVSNRCITKVPKGAHYFDDKGDEHTTTAGMLAYFTPLGDIRLLDSDADTIISAGCKDRISTFAYASRNKIWVVTDTAKNHITWFYPEAGQTECTGAVTWNYQLGTWHYWTPMNFAHGCEVETSTAASLLLFGEARVATGGYVYQFGTGASFDGGSITGTLMTKPVFLVSQVTGKPDLVRMKRHRWAVMLLEKDSSPDTLTVGWLPYDATDSDAVAGSTTISGTSRKYAALKSTTGQYFHSFGMRLKVTVTGTGGGFTMTGIELGGQILPGQQRTT